MGTLKTRTIGGGFGYEKNFKIGYSELPASKASKSQILVSKVNNETNNSVVRRVMLLIEPSYPSAV